MNAAMKLAAARQWDKRTGRHQNGAFALNATTPEAGVLQGTPPQHGDCLRKLRQRNRKLQAETSIILYSGWTPR